MKPEFGFEIETQRNIYVDRIPVRFGIFHIVLRSLLGNEIL